MKSDQKKIKKPLRDQRFCIFCLVTLPILGRGLTKHYDVNIHKNFVYSSHLLLKSVKSMDYAKLEKYASKPRLDRSLVSCANSQERALKLYEANLKVSQAFYPIMNLLETFLRNCINDKLAFILEMPHGSLIKKTGL